MHSSDPPSSRRSSGRVFELGESPSPVARLLDLIVADALKGRYEQVHLSTGGNSLRFWREGVWSDYMLLPRIAAQRLINRIRVMASLDRFNSNAPQDGAIELRIRGDTVLIRAAVRFADEGHEEVVLYLPAPPTPSA